MATVALDCLMCASPPHLSNHPMGDNFRSTGLCTPLCPTFRKELTMKLWLRVYTRPYETESNEISAAQQRGAASTEGAPWLHQRPDGQLVRRIDRTTVSQIPVGRGQTGNGLSCLDVRCDESRPHDRPCGKHRPDSRSSPLGGSANRVEQRVSIALEHGPALHVDIRLIAREALRKAALAPTDQNALDITGEALRRLADLARAEVSA